LTTVCERSGIANTPNVAAERDGQYLVEQWIAGGTLRKPFFIEDAADGLKTQKRLPEARNPD
jgi:hypothetical protein